MYDLVRYQSEFSRLSGETYIILSLDKLAIERGS
jgi:hypothetical protein